MTYNIIQTGSKGNAIIINDEILIDCGVPWKKLKPYAKSLKLVLLTHVHGDHFKPSTVSALHRDRPTLRFGCCKWMIGPLLEAGVDARVIDVFNDFEAEYIYNPSTFISPMILTHDVQNCGYKLWLSNERLFYATDTGTLDGIQAKDYDLYLIEANHTKAEIETRAAEKMERGEYAYETRAASNHLSREQAEDWLYQNMGPNSQYVFLHQHEQTQEVNNG